MQESQSLTILIADDSDMDRMLLKKIVSRQGHSVIEARDGQEALSNFISHMPDLVLLDVMMPVMSGYEAASAIKQAAGDDFVPIIFLTSLQEDDSLARCLEVGGDDFMPKPYNSVILSAKINAFNRMRGMHQTLQQQRDQIQLHNQHLIQEQQIAKKVFDNVAHAGCLHSTNIQYLLSPMAVFNGDVLLAAMMPSGSMTIMLGDFTGHGLPAAIGAMPMAQSFYSMVHKGFGAKDILREVNGKLNEILPTGVFCCACMAVLNPEDKTIEIWNGGLPDCILYRKDTGTFEKLGSKNLPLGILGSGSFKTGTEIFEMANGDRFFLWSDGIHEALNPEGEMFGAERLEAVFVDSTAEELFDKIQTTVVDFIGHGERDDDISFAEITMVDAEELASLESTIEGETIRGKMDFCVEYELRPESLKRFNPVPLAVQTLMELPALRSFAGEIYTLVAELYSNALEHGVIGLSSDLKNSPEGFAEYYRQREERLSTLCEGTVALRFDYEGDHGAGALKVSVKDSGAGFDFRKMMDNDHRTEGYCGRGLPLLKDMCRKLEYRGNGNEVYAEFTWPRASSS